jgi:serine-type D-Ala-D-Ala carboxypeptidase/endopeptidase
MGMHWFLSTANGRSSIAHDGGTGGYSSFAALDRAAKRSVVSLGDTALTSVGGFGRWERPAGSLCSPPRATHRRERGHQADRRALGPCRLQSGLGMDLRHKPNALTIQTNRPNGYDSNFCPLHSTHCCGSRKADGTASEQRLASSG